MSRHPVLDNTYNRSHDKMCGRDRLYIIRQFFVLTAGCLLSFSSGFLLSFPAVLNPSIQSPNSTFNATSEQASWIAASNGFAGIFGYFILSPLFQSIGRKYVNFGVAITLTIGWMIIFFAKSIFGLLCGRIVQGITIGAYAISSITISEYSDPKRRGYFMTMKKISQTIGSLVCHSLAFITNWRQISLIAAAPMALASILILFWPESPFFLALKGKFRECEKAFIWLHGSSEVKLKELKDLISTQTERLQKNKKSPSKLFFIKILRKLQRKDFLKPFFISSLLSVAIDASGRYFLLAYLTQMMVEITGNKSIAMYCTVASDFLLICALLTSCFIIRSFRRRKILFIIGSFSTILMFTISLVLVLKIRFTFVKDVLWFTPSLILLHSFMSHIGLVPVAYAICAEIFPLEHKGLGSFMSGIVLTTFYALTLKLTPLMIENTGVAGTYATYGTCTTICLLLLYNLLPETKDKTLQQIEDELKGVKKTYATDVLLDKAIKDCE